MRMKFVNKIVVIVRCRICYPIEKFLNTLLWLFFPNDKVIVANVYLRHIWGFLYKENLGDDLNFYLIKRLSGKTFVNYFHSYLCFFRPVNYMCIGSIVRRSNRSSIIWGSGAIEDNLDDMIERPFKVFAVRGPLTRALLLKNNIECPAVYGDPAIIFPYLYSCKTTKKYRLGIIPHIFDYDNDEIKRIAESRMEDVVVIRMGDYKNWKDVINTINECDFIASSSLHGLILSDAYHVPNVWIKLSNKVIGGNFKFFDYYFGCNKYMITGPVDFSEREIDIDELFLYKSKYIKPKYQIKQLLDVCPFADKSIINKIIERIKDE